CERESIGFVVVGPEAPLAAGVASFLSPMFRKTSSSRVRLALLEQAPDDGVPRAFPVLLDRVDAWTGHPAQRIGSVYLVRNPGDERPIALTAKCPHAGCFIGYTPGDAAFRCPCHTSAFNLDGTRVRGDAEVSPRDMDRLDVELRAVAAGDGVEVTEVWVEFVDFQTGRKDRVPQA
ncbi:MAG TPA: Rieske 2Fe-2S domain-containing protein, partial [Lacipirellulaceae bacterium]|nr:Rieske 2Fe-2S domain-containing protein [Lacipirellulaceae bacterium]